MLERFTERILDLASCFIALEHSACTSKVFSLYSTWFKRSRPNGILSGMDGTSFKNYCLLTRVITVNRLSTLTPPTISYFRISVAYLGNTPWRLAQPSFPLVPSHSNTSPHLPLEPSDAHPAQNSIFRADFLFRFPSFYFRSPCRPDKRKRVPKSRYPYR